jgi:hypothetical protein
MAEPTSVTVTCDSLDEFDDDATGFAAEDAPIDITSVPALPDSAVLTATKARWINAIRPWVTAAVDVPHRFEITRNGGPACFEVTVRVESAAAAAANSPATPLRATAIDTSSDQFVILIEGSGARAIIWTDIANIAVTSTCVTRPPPAAG